MRSTVTICLAGLLSVLWVPGAEPPVIAQDDAQVILPSAHDVPGLFYPVDADGVKRPESGPLPRGAVKLGRDEYVLYASVPWVETEHIARLKSIPRLVSFVHTQAPFDSEMCETLAECKELVVLSLDDNAIPSLQAISKLKGLKTLMLRTTELRGDALSVVQELPLLEYLEVGVQINPDRDFGVTMDSPSALKLDYLKSCTNLKYLHLYLTSIGYAGDGAVLGELTGLEALSVTLIEGPAMWDAVAKLTKLRGLNMVHTSSPEKGQLAAAVQGRAFELLRLEGLHLDTIDELTKVKSVDELTLRDTAAYGPGLEAALRACNNALRLRVDNMPADQKAFDAICAFKRLTSLALTGRHVAGLKPANLAKLKKLEYMILDIELAKGDWCDVISKLPTLQELRNVVMPRDPSELKVVMGKLAKMKALSNIPLYPAVDEDGFNYLVSIPKLQYLWFPQYGADAAWWLKGSHLSKIARLKDLKHIQLTGMRDVRDADLKVFGGHKNLEFFSLSTNEPVTGEFLASLKGLPNLYRLELGNCTHLTDAALEHIAQMKQLRFLLIQGCYKITDEGLAKLHGHPGLQHVILPTDIDSPYNDEAAMTDEGRRALVDALPNCRFGVDPRNYR
jgi:hypothetical protein